MYLNQDLLIKRGAREQNGIIKPLHWRGEYFGITYLDNSHTQHLTTPTTTTTTRNTYICIINYNPVNTRLNVTLSFFLPVLPL